VLPDLFAVLKILESNHDFVYNGTICLFSFKITDYREQAIQLVEAKQ